MIERERESERASAREIDSMRARDSMRDREHQSKALKITILKISDSQGS